ncbi:hypothetical protein DJ523_08030, partial [Sulfolobus sp. E5]
LARVKLVLMGKDDKQDYLPLDEMHFMLEILRTSNNTSYDELIVGGTLITLAYIGIGKGANRGFGRFLPLNCNLQVADNICKSIISGDIQQAFRTFYNNFNKNVKTNKVNKWENSAVPLAPLVDKSNNEAVDVITNTQCNKSDVIIALKIIQDAFLKSNFKIYVYRIEHKNDRKKKPAPYIHTWIFGLPRNVGDTGYFKDNGKHLTMLRRQSMFIVTPVKKDNSYDIYILPFLSFYDNLNQSKEIVHIGKHKKTGKHRLKVADIISSKVDK